MSVRVVQAADADDYREARGLFAEYAAALGVDLSFQGFDEELAGLPGKYAPPRGRLLLARTDAGAAGCVALRPLEEDICEMKRLYVRPAFRGLGLGHALVAAVLAEARSAGYRRVRLDTLPSMSAARELYRAFGFAPIPPYNHHPLPGTLFLELALG
jgi:GNAT superfamily N-acetyltransferase